MKTWEQYAACRLIDGHAWGRASSAKIHIGSNKAAWRIDHRCMRKECRTTRTTFYSILTGAIMQRTYHYPDGYAIPTGNKKRRNSPIKLRREYFRSHGRI